MKKLFTLFIGASLLFSSCGGGEGDSVEVTNDQIVGDYQLIKVVDKSESHPAEFKDCEKSAVWSFTNEAGEDLQDGTKTKLLTVSGDEECDMMYGFDIKENWTVVGGDELFISSTRVGGTSFAGKFKIKSIDEEGMVLTIFDAELTFKKK